MVANSFGSSLALGGKRDRGFDNHSVTTNNQLLFCGWFVLLSKCFYIAYVEKHMFHLSVSWSFNLKWFCWLSTFCSILHMDYSTDWTHCVPSTFRQVKQLKVNFLSFFLFFVLDKWVVLTGRRMGRVKPMMCVLWGVVSSHLCYTLGKVALNVFSCSIELCHIWAKRRTIECILPIETD